MDSYHLDTSNGTTPSSSIIIAIIITTKIGQLESWTTTIKKLSNTTSNCQNIA